MRNVFLRNVGLSALMCLCINAQAAQAVVKLGSYYGKWISTATYAAGDVVTFNNNTYVSLVAANRARNPSKALSAWEVFGTVAVGSASGGFNYSMTCGVSGKDACKVGAVGPGGGWIFFVDKEDEYPGFTYLEAAPTDTAGVVWCNNSNGSIYATPPTVAQYWALKGVGKGQSNTAAMVAVCFSGAANEATHYSTPTAPSGWFLPSIGESMLMYENLLKAGVGGFANNADWSSTEYDAHNAWLQSFYFGFQDFNDKNDTLPVRAVRAF